VIEFTDEGYGQMAFVYAGNSACDVVLTISERGKSSDPQVVSHPSRKNKNAARMGHPDPTLSMKMQSAEAAPSIRHGKLREIDQADCAKNSRRIVNFSIY
jgi:hypothetical protein